MTTRSRLGDAEIDAALRMLPAWTRNGDRLRLEHEFTDFAEAFTFMTAMALVSQALDHHPDWRNVYRRVEITLWTHDASGLTALDLEWARAAQAKLPQR